MATLADTGSTDVNESNPYQAALANSGKQSPTAAPTGQSFLQQDPLVNAAKQVYPDLKQGASDIVGFPEGVGKAAGQVGSDIAGWFSSNITNPKSSTPQSSDDNTAADPTGIVRQGQQFFNDTPTSAQSVANTPEASSKAQSNKEQNSNVQSAIANSLDPQKNKLPKASTEQQDVNAALAPDQAILNQLAPEYKSTMAQLAPYISSGNNTGNAALDQADAAVAQTVGSTDNAVEAGLSQLPKDSKQYAQSVSTQPIIQALLGFGKYEETYAGAQPTGQSDWSSQMDEIYKYLSGSNASNDGLGSPQAAANAAAASTVPTDTGAGGGNA